MYVSYGTGIADWRLVQLGQQQVAGKKKQIMHKRKMIFRLLSFLYIRQWYIR